MTMYAHAPADGSMLAIEAKQYLCFHCKDLIRWEWDESLSGYFPWSEPCRCKRRYRIPPVEVVLEFRREREGEE